MPALRGPDGRVIFVGADEVARYTAGGDYTPISTTEAGAASSAIAPEDTGAVGAIRAGLSGLLSGATLSGSDWVLKGIQTEGQNRQLAAERAAHPLISGTAQAAGMLLPTLVSGGTATPAGALGRLAAEGVEAGRATGGALGVAQQLAAAGGEGAIANAGIYLSDVALGDRDLTAEGINGALGTGLLIGGAGIPVSHGIEAGTIAARRMFARYAQGGAQAAGDAAAAWTEQAQRHLEAFDQTAEAAKARLVEAQAQREAAGLQQLRANAEAAEAHAFTPSQEAPGAAGAAVEPGSPVPGEPPEVAAARLLRDRAKVMGGEPITPEEVAAIEQKIGKRTYSSGPAPAPQPATTAPAETSMPLMVTRRMKQQLADLGFSPEEISNMTPRQAWDHINSPPRAATDPLEQLAQQPGVVARGPSTSVRELGMRAVPVTEDEVELGARLAEYQDARRAFNELHAQVDPDLDTLLRGIETPDVQRVPVPVGEFGAPGARGIKSPAELEAALREAGPGPLAQGTPAQAESTRVVRGAKGTPVGRSLGEVAAEQAPVPIERSGAATGERTMVRRATDEAIAGEPKLSEAVEEFKPTATKKNLSSRECADGACDMIEPDFRMAHPELKLKVHRFNLATEEGTAEVQRLYKMTDAELAEMKAENARRMKDLAVPAKDMFHQVSITPSGTVIDWTANQFHDLPVPYVFKLPARISEAEGGLEAMLRGTQEKLGAGAELKDIGEPARAEYRAAKQAKTAAAAEHFRAKAIAENYAGSAMAAEERAAQPTSDMDKFFAELRHPKTRDAYVAQNIGRAMREEGSHAAALAKVEREWAERAPAMREGHPLAVKQLEMAHDAALERAATAAEPAERAAAAAEAQAIEKQLTRVGARPGAVEDIAALAPAVTRVEKAAAALSEALGDAAPAAAKEHAAALRAAEDGAMRRATARIGQAADDAAASRSAAAARDPLAPPARAADDLLLGPSQKQQRIAAAQKAQREAGAAYAKARVAEAEARIGAKQAASAAAEARAKLGPASGAPAPRRGLASRAMHGAHIVGYAAELGSEIGIPGIPRPHDIPVIGPLLSAYLKYRALRAAAGRFVGRIPATSEARAAELAARTRDGMARAVDRSLGLIERNIPTVRSALTIGTLKVTDALSKRLIDDGGPDAKDGASVSEQAAVRIREIAAVATNPALITQAVRAQGRALTDPDLIDALSNHLMSMFQHLNSVAPKGPPPNPYTGKQWTPSTADAMRFGQQIAIAKDPQVAFQLLDAGKLTPAGADTLRNCYRLLFQEGQKRVMQRAADLKNPVAYPDLLRLGRLFDVPIHPSLEPENAAALAVAHTPAAKPMPTAQPSSPPSPSVANPTNLSGLYDAGARRAGRM